MFNKLFLICVLFVLCLSGKAQDNTTINLIVSKAGTLSELLSEEEKRSIENLAIEGKLNSCDIIVLRKMAGAKDKNDSTTWTGRLKRLDLSKASFKGDNTPYYTTPVGQNYKIAIKLKDSFLINNRRTGQVKVSGREQFMNNLNSRHTGSSKAILSEDVTRRKSNSVIDNGGRKEFKLSEITDKEWKEILKYRWNEHTDHFESRSENDSVFYVNCHTAKNWVSYCMFYRCKNLETIILHEDIERISEKAFAGCSSLKEIVIPKKVELIKTSSFKSTPSLSKVYISTDSDFKMLKTDDATIIQRYFSSSSPNLEIVRY